jgi:cellulose synthase/poly-beta-1,6-N-acetylglucosamine synthase-like glycosyltransferase
LGYGADHLCHIDAASLGGNECLSTDQCPPYCFSQNQSSLPAAAQPAVAIIIAVKDEEAEVEEALRSVCNLQYTNYRIVVINDRSTDNTPAILQKLAEANQRIHLFTITELPPDGWEKIMLYTKAIRRLRKNGCCLLMPMFCLHPKHWTRPCNM